MAIVPCEGKINMTTRAKILGVFIVFCAVMILFVWRVFYKEQNTKALFALLQADALGPKIPEDVRWRIIRRPHQPVVIAIKGIPAEGHGYEDNYRYLFIIADTSDRASPLHLGRFSRLFIRCSEIEKLETDAGGLDPAVKRLMQGLCMGD